LLKLVLKIGSSAQPFDNCGASHRMYKIYQQMGKRGNTYIGQPLGGNDLLPESKPFFGGEKQVFCGISIDRYDKCIEESGRSSHYVEMAVGQWIKTAWIDGDAL